MEEALNAEPQGPTTDTLVDQHDEPRPLGSKHQSDEPEPKKSAEETRSDSVKKAIDKALKGDDEAKEKPEAKAKADDDAKAKEKAEKDAEAKSKERGEDGKFKKKAEDGEESDGEQAESAEKPDDDAEPAKKQSAFRDPPQRFDDAAKSEWESVPETVRGAIHRSQREMEQGIEKYKADAEAYGSVKQYAEMAKQSGTDLKTALDNYTGLEKMLRQNPIQGLEQVVQNLGLKDPNGQPVTLRAIAHHITGMKPEQAAQQQDQANAALRQEIADLKRQISGVSSHVEQQQVSARQQTAQNEWQSFVQENPRAAELEGEIAEVLRKYPPSDNVSIRDRLSDAYAIVAARNPEPPAVAQTDTEPALAQTQAPRQPNPAGRKSVSGTQTGDAKSSPRKTSRHEAIAKAMRQAGI